jgi:hypothetical protein
MPPREDASGGGGGGASAAASPPNPAPPMPANGKGKLKATGDDLVSNIDPPLLIPSLLGPCRPSL